MHFAISATWGPTDPTRAMLPFIFAASAVQAGDRVTLMLFHDAVIAAVEGDRAVADRRHPSRSVGELLKLGIDVGQTTVAKYMDRRKRPPSQGWKTFLHNHADGIASMDLFVVPSISFRLLYGLLILQHGRRQILWLGVTAHPTAEWIARQFTEAYGWKAAPRYVVRDRDAVYGDVDNVVVFGEQHLRHLLTLYQRYYNEARTHLSLNKDAPVPRAIEAVGNIIAKPLLGGLHHQYVRI